MPHRPVGGGIRRGRERSVVRNVGIDIGGTKIADGFAGLRSGLALDRA